MANDQLLFLDINKAQNNCKSKCICKEEAEEVKESKTCDTQTKSVPEKPVRDLTVKDQTTKTYFKYHATKGSTML